MSYIVAPPPAAGFASRSTSISTCWPPPPLPPPARGTIILEARREDGGARAHTLLHLELTLAGGAGGERAIKVLGWPKICKFAHELLWEFSYKWLKLAQLLGSRSY